MNEALANANIVIEEIGEFCILSTPCQHRVTFRLLDKSGVRGSKLMIMPEIIELCQQTGFPIPQHLGQAWQVWQLQHTMNSWENEGGAGPPGGDVSRSMVVETHPLGEEISYPVVMPDDGSESVSARCSCQYSGSSRSCESSSSEDSSSVSVSSSLQGENGDSWRGVGHFWCNICQSVRQFIWG